MAEGAGGEGSGAGAAQFLIYYLEHVTLVLPDGARALLGLEILRVNCHYYSDR